MLRRKHQALRGMLAHSPALAISMLALVFALGSGAGYAASTTAGAGQPVFHQLKLGKGWQGHIEYTVVNGIVYLSGSVANNRLKRAPDMVTLPASVAPKAQLDIPITFGAEGDGTIQVTPDGGIDPFAPPHGNYNFVSLSGVSFAVGAS